MKGHEKLHVILNSKANHESLSILCSIIMILGLNSNVKIDTEIFLIIWI